MRDGFDCFFNVGGLDFRSVVLLLDLDRVGGDILNEKLKGVGDEVRCLICYLPNFFIFLHYFLDSGNLELVLRN